MKALSLCLTAFSRGSEKSVDNVDTRTRNKRRRDPLTYMPSFLPLARARVSTLSTPGPRLASPDGGGPLSLREVEDASWLSQGASAAPLGHVISAWPF